MALEPCGAGYPGICGYLELGGPSGLCCFTIDLGRMAGPATGVPILIFHQIIAAQFAIESRIH